MVEMIICNTVKRTFKLLKKALEILSKLYKALIDVKYLVKGLNRGW